MSHIDCNVDVTVVISDLERVLGVKFSGRTYLKVRDVLTRALPKPSPTETVNPAGGGGAWRELPHPQPVGVEVVTRAMNRLRALRDEIPRPVTGPDAEMATLHAVDALELAVNAWKDRGKSYPALRLANLARLAEEVAAQETARRRADREATGARL